MNPNNVSKNPEVFKQQIGSALSDPKEREVILEYVRKMTPNFTEKQREQFYAMTMKAIGAPAAASASSSGKTPKDYLREELKNSLKLVKQSILDIMEHRHLYYSKAGLTPPIGYSPREDVTQWDHIDVYETAAYIFEEYDKEIHEAQLKKYISYLEGKIQL